jgi:phospholipid/cholesterol/gamma-HCH transport system substrate-binding protein
MKHAKELKIGIFVVVIMTASFFLINYLRGEDIFDNEYEVVGRYDNVEGLVASAPVYIKGYKAGKVSEVNYVTDSGNFEVICSISKDFQVPNDSKMVIYAMDVMGSKAVKIDFGQADRLAQDGDLLASGFEQGLLDGLGASIQPLIAKVGNTLDSLSVLVSGVNKVLSESNVRSIEGTLANLESTISNVKSITAVIDGRSSELDAFVADLAAFSGKFEGIAEKIDSTMTGVNSVVGQLDESDLKGLVSSFKSLVDNVNDPDGSINKLMKDDSVYNSVDSLLNDVNVLVKKIQENPKKYLKISVF